MIKLKKETNNAVIKGIRNLFGLKKENKGIKDKTIRNIINLFAHEEEKNYYKTVRVSNFGVITRLNTKVTVIEKQQYQLKNNLIKLGHI